MINVDSLPKSIEYNGNVYMLDLHITAWNKLCVSYKYEGGSKRAIEEKIEYFILSQVVEPDCKEIRQTDEVIDIVDVRTWEEAFDVLSARLNTALANGRVKIYKQ